MPAMLAATTNGEAFAFVEALFAAKSIFEFAGTTRPWKDHQAHRSLKKWSLTDTKDTSTIQYDDPVEADRVSIHHTGASPSLDCARYASTWVLHFTHRDAHCDRISYIVTTMSSPISEPPYEYIAPTTPFQNPMNRPREPGSRYDTNGRSFQVFTSNQ